MKKTDLSRVEKKKYQQMQYALSVPIGLSLPVPDFHASRGGSHRAAQALRKAAGGQDGCYCDAVEHSDLGSSRFKGSLERER